MRYLVTVSRVLVGVLFIISGLVKANDPLGFSYKLDEYWAVFNVPFLSFLSLYLAIFISVFEIVLGVAALIGTRIKTASWLMLLMMVFFTFLTFYSAYFNKVTDCGCFGDAIKLTPWGSFTKDVVLLVFILIIFFNRNNITSLAGETLGSVLLVITFIGSTWFSVYCYNHLPVKDFRPYAVGNNILDGWLWWKQIKVPENTKPTIYQTFLYYEKDGVEKKFNTDDYPWEDTTWVWKNTVTEVVQKGDESPIRDFQISDFDGNDFTEEILTNPNYNFFLIAYDLNSADLKVQPKINAFVEKCQSENVPFIGLTGSGAEQTDNFRHEVQAMYDYYFCDPTTLKTIIRSNPGLVLMKGGVVIAMWHYNDFPEFSEFRKEFPKN